MNSQKTLKLPRIYDPDDDTFTVKILFDGQSIFPAGFVSYDPIL
jgi:hypothetical protein